jgi:hypothetical protein
LVIELHLLNDNLNTGQQVQCMSPRATLTSVANANPKDTLLLTYTQQCSFSFQRPFAR